MKRPSLNARVQVRTPVLARRMIRAFADDVPVYGTLPSEQLEGEVLAICEQNLRLFFQCLAEERVPADPEIADLRASAARRAEERVPLEAVIAAYHLGGRIGWEALVEEAEQDEQDELAGYATWLLRYLGVVAGAVGTAYLEEQQLIYGEERDARRAFADALFGSEEAPQDAVGRDRLLALAGRAGVELADSYVAMAVRLGPSGDERAAGVSAAIAGRRKVRRLVERLEELAGGGVLSLLDPAGGLLLIPTEVSRAPSLLDRAEELSSSLGRAADAEVLLGLSWGPAPSGVRRAADEAREVVRIAQRLGAVDGGFTSQDVLLEQALATSTPWSSRLVQVLDPLEAKPDLAATLQTWFAEDFDRQGTARALGVHPNTVDYRLQRIAEETGLDPGRARHLQLLGAALIVRTVR